MPGQEKEDEITLLEGDALEVMKTLEGPYDFIFMDAAKGTVYPLYAGGTASAWHRKEY